MAIKAKNLIPVKAIHPGEILKDELASRGISQTVFTSDTGIALPHLNEIIKGKRNITAETALILEKALGIDAQFWMNLQSNYEIDLSRIKEKVRDKISLIERWSLIKTYVPVKFFKRQNLLTDNLEQNEKTVKDIYRANNIEDIISSTSKPCYAHFKRSTAFSENIINVAGWVNYVAYQSRNKSVGKFSEQQKDQIVKEFKIISSQKDIIKNTEKLLNKYGIIFIIQSKPDNAPIDGVSFWSGTNPTIGVTLRYKRLDNFVFTIMHELAHIFLHLTKNKNREFVDNMEDHNYMNQNSFEKEANYFAANNLIDETIWKEFVLNHFSIDEADIIEFAELQNIHPAIVKGRLCFEQPVYYRKRYSIPNEIS